MSFAEKWKSRKDSYSGEDNKGKNNKEPDIVPFVLIVPGVGTLKKYDQWGNHAHLVEWFLNAKEALPKKWFTIARGEGWSLTWATPVESYQVLEKEIEKGPEGENSSEVRNNLLLLHNLFAGGHSVSEVKPNPLQKNE